MLMYYFFKLSSFFITMHIPLIDRHLPGRSYICICMCMCMCVEREREETMNNNNNNRELQVAEQYYIYTDVRACNFTYIYSSIYIFNILLYILPRNHDEIITTKVKQWHLHR